ncbi:hypothetical protein GGR52DRAFT_569373 [Hypoxylon sp. FL1284]|nr:hypothetical protein GGR52DRAFT_569373 [Hypoxylon sp. FL1284]
MAASTTTAVTASTASGDAPSVSVSVSVSVLFVTVKPLTTTFTPPAFCNEGHLTQVSSPGYRIWLNEPQPVPLSKFGDCYPSDFINGYTSAGQTVEVTAFDSSSVIGTSPWVAAATDHAYAHPIDGFGLTSPTSAVPSSTAVPEGSAAGTQTTSSPTSSATASSHLSGGVIAGLVIGCVAAVSLILAAVLILARRHQQRKKAGAPSAGGEQYPQSDKDDTRSPTSYADSGYCTSRTFDSRGAPLAGARRHELGFPEPRELDSGYTAPELEPARAPRGQNAAADVGEGGHESNNARPQGPGYTTGYV